jgi:acyl-CoA hydrolase
LVEIDARIIAVIEGRIHVSVQVRSGGLRSDSFERTTQCICIFAMPEGSDASAPPLLRLNTREDVRLALHAHHLMALREQLVAVPRGTIAVGDPAPGAGPSSTAGNLGDIIGSPK